MTRGTLLAAMLLCIWDRDTRPDELRGVPDSTRLVTGHWVRHGPEYYRARLRVLPAHLRDRPHDLDAYDDLAVAHERLGERDAAIAVMARKAEALKARPDAEHEYRYHANLGTFLAHAGRLEEGLVEIERAVALNPSAHFDRERFQIAALRYAIAVRADPSVWERENFLSWAGVHLFHTRRPAETFSFTAPASSYRTMADWDAAFAAVAGMLRFGGTEGAELHRTLGDLHLLKGNHVLAWFCFHNAVERGHPASTVIRRAIAAIDRRWDTSAAFTAPVESDYRAVRDHARRWLETFHRGEAEAVARGEDPGSDEVLRRLVDAADREVADVPYFLPSTQRLHSRLPAWFVYGVVIVLGLGALRVVFGSGWKSHPHVRQKPRTGPGASLEEVSLPASTPPPATGPLRQ